VQRGALSVCAARIWSGAICWCPGFLPMAQQPIILTDQIVPPPALVRASLETLPTIIRAQGERAGRFFALASRFFQTERCGWRSCAPPSGC
jgi:hypothetical protein